MSYSATVLPVMIASPGDVEEERNLARDVIDEWNSAHSIPSRAILTAVGWEKHAAADLGGRAQHLINERVLKQCDVLVGIFWNRLGTPTAEFESGTVEEIETHLATKKLAMVYFSDAPAIPSTIDPVQRDGVLRFKEWCRSRGVAKTYKSRAEFRNMLSLDLQIQMNTHPRLLAIRESALVDNFPPPAVFLQPAENDKADRPKSAEAKELLHDGASDRNGQIIVSKTLTHPSIVTNRKAFGREDARAFAKWQAALEELAVAKLVKLEREDQTSAVFTITDKGYKAAN
jgi:hypothetical protein